jgi:predicted ATPase
MRTELVGRERELAVLVASLDAALAGEPRVVLCRGEPGIGKTRLAEELAERGTARGVPVVWGRAIETAGAPPYWPWRQVLRAVALGTDLRGIAEEHRLTADLSRLAPDVFGNDLLDPTGGSTEDRFRQFDAAARLLREVTQRRPLVVVFDDAHQADDASVLLLQHVVRTLAGQRLLVVVNHRDTEPVHDVLVAALPREPASRQLDLRGLPLSAVGRQLTSLVGHALPDNRIAEVHAATGGNPFFVAELGRVLAERDPGAGPAPVTATVRESIAARLSRLSPECVRLVQVASVVGRGFSVALVAKATGTPVLSCLGPVDEAVAAGLVEPAAAAGEYRFAHVLVRDAIDAELASRERLLVHRAVAEAIEELAGGRPEPHLSDLSRHWAAAAVLGERARAAGWVERAGEEAMRRLAYEDGARLYGLALRVGGSELGDGERCQLLLALARARYLSGDLVGQLEACRELAVLARASARPDLVAEAALLLESGGDAESDRLARQLCEEALAGLGPEQSPLRARVTARLSDVYMYSGDLGAAGAASAEALHLAERCGDRAAVVAALRARQLVCSGPDGLGERTELAERILALGRAGAESHAQMWAHLWQIDVGFQPPC